MKCEICQEKTSYSLRCQKHKNTSTRQCYCGAYLSKRNKTGKCKDHVDRSGKNNPMYGKTVYETWVKKYGKDIADERDKEHKIKIALASKTLWENEDYRKKIKDTTTGLKRSDEFKKTQRINAIKQFTDPRQRELRSIAITNSFINGTHNPDVINGNRWGKRGFDEYGNFYASLTEKNRIKYFIDKGYNWKRYHINDFEFRLNYEWNGKPAIYIPDFIIYVDDRIIIEELKCRLNGLSDRELYKAKIASDILPKYGIEYHLNHIIDFDYYSP